jgi:CubicO group peptidase (beta-lactamase class C family)
VQARYSGGGTTLAGLLVADVLGKPLPQIMHELVLEPLGMKHSTFEQPLPTKWHQSAATAHAAKGDPVPGKWHVYPELAPDGLWTTPSDLARAGIEMQLAFRGESNRLLSAASATEMLTPVVESVGIAFMMHGKDKSVRFGHGGSNEGFQSQMTMYKELGRGAVIMINSNDGFPILREIDRAIAREYDWPDHTLPDKKAFELSSGALDAFVGDYASESGFACAIARRDNRLFLKSTGQPALELISESGTNFFATAINIEVTFERTEKGEVKGLTLEQDHRQTVAQKKR